jgi:hypothetical protein
MRPASFFLVVYFVASLFVFFEYVDDSLKGENQLRIGADSSIYLLYAAAIENGALDDDVGTLITFSTNLFGPVLIAELLGRDNFSIVIFNYAVFFITVFCVWYAFRPNIHVFMWLLLINPLTLSSLLTLGKELIALLGICLFAIYLKDRRRVWILLVGSLVSVLARWQQAALILAFAALTSRANPLRNRRRWMLGGLVLFITIAYPLVTSFFNQELHSDLLEGNTILALDKLQDHYLFAVVVIPKMALNVMGEVLNIGKYASAENLDVFDLQNTYFMLLHEIAFIGVLVVAWKKRLLTLHSDLVLFCVLYVLVFSISPFVQPRYMYPCFGLVCLLVAEHYAVCPVPGKSARTAVVEGHL